MTPAQSRPGPGTHPTAVTAHARIVATTAKDRTVLPVLHGDGPLALRRLRSTHTNQARVCLLGAMSAPLNGDHLRLDIDAGPHTRLHFSTAAATVALPGRSTEPAHHDVHLRVGEHAQLHYLPEQLVSAAGSNLHTTLRVDLAPTAHLILREEQILGRADEPPGTLTSRLTVHTAGTPLLDQHTAYGNDTTHPAWDGPAGLAGHRALGQLLLIGPHFPHPTTPQLLTTHPTQGEAAALPLTPTATLITALAPTALHLRHLLTPHLPPDPAGQPSAPNT